VTGKFRICAYVYSSPESYTDYDPSSPLQTVYIIEDYANCKGNFLLKRKIFLSFFISAIINYKLFGIAGMNNLSNPIYFGPFTNYDFSHMYYWYNSGLLDSKIPRLDHAGTNFNFKSRYMLVCGGLQVELFYQQ